MKFDEIQAAVRRLPAARRKKMTVWMVSEFPALSVERLLAKAAREARNGTWYPSPPTAANFPAGKTLAHALRVAGRLTLRR